MMTQRHRQPGEQPPAPQNVAVNAADGSLAAYHIEHLNAHITVEGSDLLASFLQRCGIVSTPTGDPVGDIKQHLGGRSNGMSVQDVVRKEFRRLRGLPEFNLENYQDISEAQALSDRVIDATHASVGIVAVLAFWGDQETDRWWMSELERLAKIDRRGGNAWLLNLPLVSAAMTFYAAGTAAVCQENYGRLLKLFALHGQPISPAGPAPLSRMLAPNPSAIKLTAAQNFQAVSTTVAEALHLSSEDVDEAWQHFEILRLATQLMEHRQFDSALGNYTAADRRRAATTGIDPVAAPQAEATKNQTLDSLARCCPVGGLHLRAVDKVWTAGADFRWGSPIAEWIAAEVHRRGSAHPLVIGLNASADRIEMALLAVSRAVGMTAVAHRANWVSGVGPEEIWLDS